MAEFRAVEHENDFCVVGGGMAGMAAAISAARHGAEVILMQDRPVLGGNASSEIRVPIGGADRHNRIPNVRETGLLEEIRLENLHRNPNRNFSIWDTVLYEKAHFQDGLALLLNCSCCRAKMNGNRIESVTGWQTTTQTWHTVRAKIFADCSGDAVLAPLTGAETRTGREGRNEFGESIAPEKADDKTMGMTLYFCAREYDTPQKFRAPKWAYKFNDEDLPYGPEGHRSWKQGYWWIELGGEQDTIHDTEELRDELLKTVYGVWDHIKNRGEHGADNWALDWVQFLPGKRESRRYIGKHIVTQDDVRNEGRFDDIVGHGGWTMDVHHSLGFHCRRAGAPATVFHPAPSPYGIPYRALYAKRIENLVFAGRCASFTHVAMSSARVMGTCTTMGQAIGTATAVAVRSGATPAEVDVAELQELLMRDDCWLPGLKQQFGELTTTARLAASHGDPEPLRDGVNRPVGDVGHDWKCRAGDSVEYTFGEPREIKEVTFVFNTALDKDISPAFTPGGGCLTVPADVIPKAFHVELLKDGKWAMFVEVEENYQRLVRFRVGEAAGGVRFTLDGTWRADETSLYAFYVD